MDSSDVRKSRAPHKPKWLTETSSPSRRLVAVTHDEASDRSATEPASDRLGVAFFEPGRLFVGARDHYDLVCGEVT